MEYDLENNFRIPKVNIEESFTHTFLKEANKELTSFTTKNRKVNNYIKNLARDIMIETKKSDNDIDLEKIDNLRQDLANVSQEIKSTTHKLNEIRWETKKRIDSTLKNQSQEDKLDDFDISKLKHTGFMFWDPPSVYPKHVLNKDNRDLYFQDVDLYNKLERKYKIDRFDTPEMRYYIEKFEEKLNKRSFQKSSKDVRNHYKNHRFQKYEIAKNTWYNIEQNLSYDWILIDDEDDMNRYKIYCQERGFDMNHIKILIFDNKVENLIYVRY